MAEVAGGVGLAFGYVLVAVIVWRAMGRGEDEAFMAAMWPVLVPLFLATCVVWFMIQAAIWLTDAPAHLAEYTLERRKLRKAERIKRLREAEKLLAEEGLDFNP